MIIAAARLWQFRYQTSPTAQSGVQGAQISASEQRSQTQFGWSPVTSTQACIIAPYRLQRVAFLYSVSRDETGRSRAQISAHSWAGGAGGGAAHKSHVSIDSSVYAEISPPALGQQIPGSPQQFRVDLFVHGPLPQPAGVVDARRAVGAQERGGAGGAVNEALAFLFPGFGRHGKRWDARCRVGGAPRGRRRRRDRGAEAQEGLQQRQPLHFSALLFCVGFLMSVSLLFRLFNPRHVALTKFHY